MLVNDLMVEDVATIPPDATCADAAKVMRAEDVGLLVLAQHGRLAGVVSDRSLVVDCIAAGLDPATTPVGQIAAGAIYTVWPDQPIEAAVRAMREFGFRRLPVVDQEGTILGVISMADIAPYVRQMLDDLLVETASYSRVARD